MTDLSTQPDTTDQSSTSQSSTDQSNTDQSSTDPAAADTVTLSPSYKLPIAIVLISLPILLWAQLWLGIIVALLGFFLLYQTSTIRLLFTATALEVRRKESLLKTFPYAEWESWKVFWPPAPILFYFKEVNSIHFLPVLFAPTELQAQLQTRCPNCAV